MYRCLPTILEINGEAVAAQGSVAAARSARRSSAASRRASSASERVYGQWDFSDNAALAVVPVTAAVNRSRRPRYRLSQHVTPRAHRLAARRAGVLMQAPFTRCMPGPHASRTLITMSSGCCRGAPRGMACTDDAKVRAKAIAINLSIASLSCLLESANARRFFAPRQTNRGRS